VSYSATHKAYICRLQIRPITILHVPQWVLVVQNGSRYPSAIVSVIKEQSNCYKRANILSVIKKLIFIHLCLSRKKFDILAGPGTLNSNRPTFYLLWIPSCILSQEIFEYCVLVYIPKCRVQVMVSFVLREDNNFRKINHSNDFMSL
jgi:hypothetical protein